MHIHVQSFLLDLLYIITELTHTITVLTHMQNDITSDMVLPIIDYDPAINYSQIEIIYKMQEYADARQLQLLFESHPGLCSGLLTYWAYLLRMLQERRFKQLLEYVLAWDAAAFAAASDKEDPIMEYFINNVLFLHFDTKLRNISQAQLHENLNLLLDDELPRFANAEFAYTFVFNCQSLRELLTKMVFPNKLVRVTNAFHVVGFMLSGGKYHYYDPEHVPVIYATLDDLVEAIFQDLSKSCGSKEFMTLDVSVHDLDYVEPKKYPDPVVYSRELLQDAKYKQGVMQHPVIFKYLMQERNYAIANVLVAFGYEWVPWTKTPYSELAHAINTNDHVAIDYLIAHGIPLDYIPPDAKARSALGNAIIYDKIEMLYKLLAAGADPNCYATHDNDTCIDIALYFKHTEMLILLLAYGAKFSEREQQDLKEKYIAKEIKLIFERALAINFLIMQLPSHLVGKKATAWQVIDFCIHEKLRAELDEKVPVKMTQEIIEVINAAVTKLTKKKFTKLSAAELYELETIQETIDTMVTHKNSADKELHKFLEHANAIISKYLTKNHITSLDAYLDEHKQDFYSRQQRSMVFSLPQNVDAAPKATLSFAKDIQPWFGGI